MLLSDFDFDLPPELIAQTPLAKRSDSRLLCLSKETGDISHYYFRDLPQLLNPHDLLVLNDTKVIPARLHTNKITGGKVEILIERVTSHNECIAQTKSNKPLKIGDKLILSKDAYFEVKGRKNNLFELFLHSPIPLETILENFGNTPLPPYIRRDPDINDQDKYQTIYAKHRGAVAAPTAGLHFDKELMLNLEQKNIKSSFITLHVGLGTFQPVREEKIENHKIHQEYICVSEETCNEIISAKSNNKKIVAVGTTSIRALESASQSGKIKPFQGDTDIFIYPGYKFKITDTLITNFHLPKTSLLMLISAFAGYENTMNAYQEAIKEKYRFYSYGDAMIII